MKTKILLPLILIALFFGCAKEPAAKGKVVFWNNAASGLGIVVVVMADNTSGNITQDYTSAPDCGAAGCFTYEADAGTYSYTAAESGTSKTWSGSVTITSGGCQPMMLY